jgi:hypothetical protein
MKFSRGMFWGGLLGLLMGVAATIFSLFQFDPEETTATEVIAAGLLIGAPVTAAAGVLVGWLWDMWFGRRRTSPPPSPQRQRGHDNNRR